LQKEVKSALRNLPGVDKLLESGAGAAMVERHGKPAVASALRRGVEAVRNRILQGDELLASVDADTLKVAVFNIALENLTPRLRRVINATGVVVHTNLGRAPLASEAVEAMAEVAPCYSNLEYDLEQAARGSRQSLIEELLCELVGAEAAMAVNNNAGAVFLALTAVARGGEVVVSRGELVEIGGSFRVPDVMAASGAIMKEVGTTNKTKLDDYVGAINENTAALLKVHRSNFYIRGFTQEATVEQLARLADEKGLPLIADLGSGCLVDTGNYGLPQEPTPRQTLERGAHLVTFSGDKLLGGPQAGIIVGRKEWVGKLSKHPVHRALRVDKSTLAALEATLRLYRAGKAEEKIPVVKMISMTQDKLKRRASSLAKELKRNFASEGLKGFGVEIARCTGKVGGGAMADADLPSWGVALTHGRAGPDNIFRALVDADTPVVGRIHEGKFLLDVRTLWNVTNRELSAVVAGALKRFGER